MHHRPRLGQYYFTITVVLLLCFVSVGYSSWADTLKVSGSISLVTPAPTSTQAPSVPPGFCSPQNGKGYKYWSDQLFDSPFWTYRYKYDSDSIGEVSGSIQPNMQWVGNTLYVTGNVYVPYQPYNGNKMLVHFISEVGTAIQYTNTSAVPLFFAGSKTDNPFVQDFVRLSDMSYSKIGLSIPKEGSSFINDRMVVSVFNEDNWALPVDGLDLTNALGLTYTESKKSSFTISNGNQSIEYSIVFVLTISTSLTATSTLSPTISPAPTQTQTIAPNEALDHLLVQKSDVAYKSHNDSVSAPYWIYQTNYNPNNQYISGEKTPDSNYENRKLSISMNVVYPEVATDITNFVSVALGALKFDNNSESKVELEIISVDNGLYAHLAKPKGTTYGPNTRYKLGIGETMFASVYSDYSSWVFQNISFVHNEPQAIKKRAVIQARVPDTDIYQNYIIEFTLSLQNDEGSALQTAYFSDDISNMLIGNDSENPGMNPPPQISESVSPSEPTSIPGTTSNTDVPNGPSLPTAEITNTGYEEKLTNRFTPALWSYSFVDRQEKAVQNEFSLSPYWKKDTLILYGNINIPQAGTPGKPLLQRFDVKTGAALEFANNTGVDLEFTLTSISKGLDHSFAQHGGSISQQSSVLLPTGERMTVSAFVKDVWAVGADGLDLENQPGMSFLQEKEMIFKVTNTVTRQSKTYTLRFVLSLKTEEPAATVQPTQTPAPVEIPGTTETPILVETPAPANTPIVTFAPEVLPSVQPVTITEPLSEPSQSPTAVPISTVPPQPTAFHTQGAAAAPMLNVIQPLSATSWPAPTPAPETIHTPVPVPTKAQTEASANVSTPAPAEIEKYGTAEIGHLSSTASAITDSSPSPADAPIP